MLDALARICLCHSRARMSTGTNGAIYAVQTNLQMYDELELYTYYCCCSLGKAIESSVFFVYATAILEACAHVVTSSEMLTATFDCDIYPDSVDENECKDTTRGTVCHSNEFQCADKTCIPSQWRYDQLCNLKPPRISLHISFTLISDAIISRIAQMPKTKQHAHSAHKMNSSKYHAIAFAFSSN